MLGANLAGHFLELLAMGSGISGKELSGVNEQSMRNRCEAV